MNDPRFQTGPLYDPGILIQVHIPRCAGTSIGNWLRNAAMAGVLGGFRAVYPNFVLEDEEDFLAAGFADPRLAAVTTHNIQRFPARLCGRRAHYFTILREPRSHVLLDRAVHDPGAFRINLPSHLGDDTGDVAAWLLSRPLNAPFRENSQTNHLALHTWCKTTSGRCHPEMYGTWSTADQRAYENERLDVAKTVLHAFLCVGVVERLYDSVELLTQRSRVLGIDLLAPQKLGHINATNVPSDDLRWMNADTPLGRRLRESIAVDLELYQYACDMLDAARPRSRMHEA